MFIPLHVPFGLGIIPVIALTVLALILRMLRFKSWNRVNVRKVMLFVSCTIFVFALFGFSSKESFDQNTFLFSGMAGFMIALFALPLLYFTLMLYLLALPEEHLRIGRIPFYSFTIAFCALNLLLYCVQARITDAQWSVVGIFCVIVYTMYFILCLIAWGFSGKQRNPE